MNYIEHTNKGFVDSKNVVKLYDIIQPRVGFWKNKLAIITAVKDKIIHARIIENGMDTCFKLKDVVFVNHNTKTAAKSYFELCEQLRGKFVAKYSNIDYIKEHFNDDPMIINDIVATALFKGANVYVSNNPNQYSTLAVNMLAKYKDLITAIIELDNSHDVENLFENEIKEFGTANYIKLIKFLHGQV